jgi:hypothetical protein
VWTAKPDGTYKPYVEITLATNGLDTASGGAILRAADLNAGGRLDLVVANPRASSITILTNKSKQVTQCSTRVDGAAVVSCSPVDGAVIDATDLMVSCSASSPQAITGCTAYIDGIRMYSTVGATFQQQFLISPGKHVVVVRAWDKMGHFFSTVRHMTLFNHYLAICPPGALGTVNFCVPARDGPVISPVRVLATGSSDAVVTATNIYVDNILTLVGGMFIDTRFSLGSGPHRIVAQSWNREGSNFLTARNVTVTSQGCPVDPVVSVNVCSPSSGATVSSPVHLEAIANSNQPITGWRVYLNNTSIFGSFDKQLSTDLVLPKGALNLLIKAWDSQGRIVGAVTRSVHVQ